LFFFVQIVWKREVGENVSFCEVEGVGVKNQKHNFFLSSGLVVVGIQYVKTLVTSILYGVFSFLWGDKIKTLTKKKQNKF